MYRAGKQHAAIFWLLLCLCLCAGPILVARASDGPARQSVKLAWDACSDPEVVGYRLYYGKASGEYTQSVTVSNVTFATICDLTEGLTYYFVVRAFNAAGLESDPSNETSDTIPTSSPAPVQSAAPAAAGTLVTLDLPAGNVSGQGLRLAWNASTDPDVVGYRVYYGNASGEYTQSVTVSNVTFATLPDLTEGLTYYFVIRAFNAAGLESDPSNEISNAIPTNSSAPVQSAAPAGAGTLVESAPPVGSLPGQSLKLAWGGSPDPDVVGYRVYYGNASGEYTQSVTVSNVTFVTISDLTEGLTYYFVVRAFNAAGLESDPSNEISNTIPASSPAPVRSAAPAAAGTLAASDPPVGSVSGQSLRLAWDASTDPDVVGYRVYYGNASGEYTQSVTVSHVTFATIPDLTEGLTYYFVIRAFNAAGLESDPSNEISNTIPTSSSAPVQSAAPAGAGTLVASDPPVGGVSGRSLRLAWDASTDPDVVGYRVYYGNASGEYTQSVTVSNVTFATISDLTEGLTYYFAIRAFNAAGLESDPSNEISDTIPTSSSAPVQSAAPAGAGTLVTSGLPAGSVSRRSLGLAWDASTDPDVVGYRVYYGNASGEYTQSVTVSNVTFATISDLTEGLTYYFVIRAFNAAGLESDPSNEISNTIPTSSSAPVKSTAPTDARTLATSDLSEESVPATQPMLMYSLAGGNSGSSVLRVYAVEPPAADWQLQVSTDLANWQTVAAGGLGDLIDYSVSNVTQAQQGFYRVAMGPASAR